MSIITYMRLHVSDCDMIKNFALSVQAPSDSPEGINLPHND